MKRQIKILGIVGSLLLLLALLVSGCRNGASPVLEKFRVVQVGAILPLDGPWSTLGKHAEVALNLALGTLNTYLSKDNLQLELKVENSSGDAVKALAALKTLHAAGVGAVIGPMTSDEAAGIVDYANSNGIMLVSPSSTAESLALPDNLFRLAPNDSNQAEALANLMNHQGITRVLPVYLDDVYGRAFEEGFRIQAGKPETVIEVLKSISYDLTVTDFGPQVKVISDAVAAFDPATTGILFIGRDTDAISIFSSAGAASPLANFKWFSTGIIREDSILSNARAAAFASKVRFEGFTFACEATAPVVPTMLATSLMSVELGGAPSPSSLTVWDALWFVGEAYRLDPQASPGALMENFKSVVNNSANFSGQTTKLDINGDMIPVRYACFAVEEIDGVARWNLKSMFVKSINVGNVSMDATSNMTRETGEAVIGAVLPLSGGNSENGLGALKTINLALKQANDYYKLAEGLGINFKLEVRDSGSDPATALTQVKALHELGIDLLIGPVSSGELAAVQEYVKANGMIIISTTSTAPSLASPDDRILRLTPDDTHQAKALTRLINSQEKQHVMLIYRNDRYGQDFARAFAELYKGSIDSFIYETSEISFSPVLERTSSRIKEIGTTDNVAVLVVGLKEITRLLERVETGPLTAVDWYGTDGICKSRELLNSKRAVAVAEQTHLTCSAFDMAAAPFFFPADYVLEAYLAPLLGGPSAWKEISACDALWISASAFAMTSPHAGAAELWNYIKKLYATTGMGGTYVFNENGDQSVSLYAFYGVEEIAGGPAWKATAFYRDYFVMRDNLHIVGQ